jgi:phosphopantothenoylcysteine decarboxylase/phosphopantothenate--cysteine ligase
LPKLRFENANYDCVGQNVEIIILENKTVVVGVCGGIAAYKAALVVSKLKKSGADVHVMLAKTTAEFVIPLVFETISQNSVVSEIVHMKHFEIEHISLAQTVAVVIIVPATANIINKVASGIADDIISATIMATKAPVIFAMAINNMYENPAVQNSIKTLSGLGYSFIEPVYDSLMCGTEGCDSLADVDDIVEAVIAKIFYTQDFKGKKILVTAGSTREYIDAVRFISNPLAAKWVMLWQRRRRIAVQRLR